MNLAILHGWTALFEIQKHLFVVKAGSTNVKSHFPNWQTGFCYVNFHYFDEDTMPSVHHKKAEQIDKSSQPLLAIAGDHAPRSYQIRMAIVNLIDGLSVCQWEHGSALVIKNCAPISRNVNGHVWQGETNYTHLMLLSSITLYMPCSL